MDTTVVWCCPERWANIGFVIMTSFLFFSCPSEDQDCNDLGSIARLDDLITLIPKQTHYNVDDTLTLKVSIPRVKLQPNFLSYIWGVLYFNDLFTDNNLNISIGSQADFINSFYMPYNSDTEIYELNVEITLNNIGNYSFVTDDTIEIIGDGCDRFVIETNIL